MNEGRRRATPLSELLRRSVPAKARARLFSVDLVRERWDQVVGESLASKAEPFRLSDGVLTVRVADARWGRMVVQMAPEIIHKLNEVIGFRLVKRINFAKYSGAPVRRASGQAPKPPGDPKPLDPPAEVAAATSKIDDEELAAALARVATRSLNRRRPKS